MKKLEEYVTTIPDFPEKGIMFRDITSVIQDADGFKLAVDTYKEMLEGVDFDVIVGAEARGFIFGSVCLRRDEFLAFFNRFFLSFTFFM